MELERLDNNRTEARNMAGIVDSIGISAAREICRIFNEGREAAGDRRIDCGNARYIHSIWRTRCGNYEINGEIGERTYMGYTQREAVRMYNGEAKAARRARALA